MTQFEVDQILQALKKVQDELIETINGHTYVKGKCADYNIQNDNGHIFLPGAFDSWLKRAVTVPLLFEHNPDLVAGETKVFQSKNDGLYHTSILHNSPVGRDMKRLIDAGVLDSFSIAYSYRPKENRLGDSCKGSIHTVFAIDELSIVHQPAAPGAIIEGSKKSRESNIKDLEKRLDRFWLVERKLESKEVYEFILSKWREVVRDHSHRVVNQKPLYL